jgi:glycosyltransferase involved in cell wall biosynthesis
VIPDAEMPALYRLAEAFVFPSLKEGWGLVVLEAIASGLPVITSRQPPFTEFLTEAHALLINPNSSSELAQAMHTVLKPELAKFWVQRSQVILPHYSWAASATKHLEHYHQLVNSDQ